METNTQPVPSREDPTAENKKMEILGRLAGPIIHDLNNLLTVIQLNSSLLEENLVEEEERQSMIEEISRACQSASELTKTMLSVARNKRQDKRPLEVRQFVNGIARLLEALMAKKAVLKINLPAEPVWMDADYSAMSQVLMNLIVNAVDSMSGGEIELTAAPIAGIPDRDPERKCVEFSIRDCGCGIPADILPHIFDPYFTTKDFGKGTGLGLHIVRETVTRFGGWIDVRSEPGVGTTFLIYIPATDDPSSAPPAKKVPQISTPTPGGTILLVEDEPGIRSIAKTILEQAGFRILESGDADEALAIWNERKDDIRLLFTDVVLPGTRNGCDLAEECLRDRKNLPVIYTSGYARPDVEGGPPAENFIAKPYRPDDLVRMVRRRLAEANTLQGK